MSLPTHSQLEALINRVKHGISTVELVHAPHNRWPYHRERPSTPPLKISVLDSSFNPPTRAHLALASLPPQHHAPDSSYSDFDARILVLSVRNVDKGLKPSDATYAQRLEMMIRLATDLQTSSQTDNRDANVGVAIIDEPTFVGKARILTDFLQQRTSSLSAPSPDFVVPTAYGTPTPSLELTFLVGMDTLDRILAPRYYPSLSDMRTYLKAFMATSRLVCARRVIPGELRARTDEKEKEIESRAHQYMDLERLAIVDLEGDIESYSSSEVRRRIGEGDQELWRTMVTGSIAEYIVAQGLYQPGDATSAAHH
ncbi:hypothetical protein BDY19DRAFT_933390 [Irpex rosettiformis]|uniref:Uncharacterized protein n=1 Tax=Irpex rosettiformis TaxID=378272 RepID=A0ACB8U9P2_9APHY|nr:hypothetical protein BDY19DRAFT_933390 [Irpex rosettiformis]